MFSLSFSEGSMSGQRAYAPDRKMMQFSVLLETRTSQPQELKALFSHVLSQAGLSNDPDANSTSVDVTGDLETSSSRSGSM